MSNFSLIQQLEAKTVSEETKPELPKGIKYQEYTIECEGKDVDILIPLREVDAFEATLMEHDKYIDRENLRLILRKHRGLRT